MILGYIKRNLRLLLEESRWRLASTRRTAIESACEARLRQRIRGLPRLGSDGHEALSSWMQNRIELRTNISYRDPRNFLQWPVVLRTMFYVCPQAELEYLMASVGWPLWQNILPEVSTGNPKHYGLYPESSGNIIHYAYHLAQFTAKDPVSFSDMDVIFEFGGGYGGMARLLHKAGFDGTHIIFDLPEFSALQEYYLGASGLKVFTTPTREKGVVVLSSLDDLKRQCQLTPNLDLFIATWSLSESPVELRRSILDTIGRPARWLIAFQERFDGVDNLAYFNELVRKSPDVSWDQMRIGHMAGSHYLFGKKRV